jgi:16S rRNA G966 N2-methylase RsmD
LRAEIADILKTDGWDDKTARMLAGWDPYDQNASASFFDSEWMFGLKEGFDIVIGNPPYSAEISSLDREKIACKDTKNSNSAAIFIDVAKKQSYTSVGFGLLCCT